jgi:hypothetical protein
VQTLAEKLRKQIDQAAVTSAPAADAREAVFK